MLDFALRDGTCIALKEDKTLLSGKNITLRGKNIKLSGKSVKISSEDDCLIVNSTTGAQCYLETETGDTHCASPMGNIIYYASNRNVLASHYVPILGIDTHIPEPPPEERRGLRWWQVAALAVAVVAAPVVLKAGVAALAVKGVGMIAKKGVVKKGVAKIGKGARALGKKVKGLSKKGKKRLSNTIVNAVGEGWKEASKDDSCFWSISASVLGGAISGVATGGWEIVPKPITNVVNTFIHNSVASVADSLTGVERDRWKDWEQDLFLDIMFGCVGEWAGIINPSESFGGVTLNNAANTFIKNVLSNPVRDIISPSDE